jgi:exopolysaccharide biosynthesis polyprenyl glycosylphosphotransferase
MKKKFIKFLLILAGDALIVPFCYWAAYFIRFGTLLDFRNSFSPIFLLMLTFAYLLVFYFFDLYATPRQTRFGALISQIIFATGVSAILASLLKYVFFLFPIGRGILVIANGLIFVLIFAWRRAGALLFRYMIKPRAVLLMGTGRGTEEIIQILESNPREYRFIGILMNEELKDHVWAKPVKDLIVGPVDKLVEVIEESAVDIIVLTDATGKQNISADGLIRAHLRSIEVVDVPGLYKRLMSKIPIDYIQDENWFLQTKGFALVNNHFVGKIKRFFDAVLSGCGLLVSFPLWPFIAMLIRAESKGHVFYSQTRVGKNEVPFSLFKFRSMVEGAEEAEPVWAEENDRRVTTVGRLLRKLHLDELPQLWNVLRGEMSLVGPRPERPEFVSALEKEIPFYALRHFVKPGITGWAQINYPYAASTKDSKEKLEYDLYYISQMNVIFDLKILVKTATSFFPGKRSGKNSDNI